jgi:hypothetical protein
MAAPGEPAATGYVCPFRRTGTGESVDGEGVRQLARNGAEAPEISVPRLGWRLRKRQFAFTNCLGRMQGGIEKTRRCVAGL